MVTSWRTLTFLVQCYLAGLPHLKQVRTRTDRKAGRCDVEKLAIIAEARIRVQRGSGVEWGKLHATCLMGAETILMNYIYCEVTTIINRAAIPLLTENPPSLATLQYNKPSMFVVPHSSVNIVRLSKTAKPYT
jgi:hypothetical protein